MNTDAINQDEETRALLSRRAATADNDVRQALLNQAIELNLGIAYNIATRFRGRGVESEDLDQVASLGLVKAAHSYDPATDTPFLAYAVPSIRGEVKRYFRDSSWTIRIPRRLQELDPTLRARVTEIVDGENGEFDRDSALDHGYELGEDRIVLQRGFHVLDDRERLLLRLAYFEGLSQAQIGARVGISQIHVSRLTRRALGKLRAEIGNTNP